MRLSTLSKDIALENKSLKIDIAEIERHYHLNLPKFGTIFCRCFTVSRWLDAFVFHDQII